MSYSDKTGSTGHAPPSESVPSSAMPHSAPRTPEVLFPSVFPTLPIPAALQRLSLIHI